MELKFCNILKKRLEQWTKFSWVLLNFQMRAAADFFESTWVKLGNKSQATFCAMSFPVPKRLRGQEVHPKISHRVGERNSRWCSARKKRVRQTIGKSLEDLQIDIKIKFQTMSAWTISSRSLSWMSIRYPWTCFARGSTLIWTVVCLIVKPRPIMNSMVQMLWLHHPLPQNGSNFANVSFLVLLCFYGLELFFALWPMVFR